MKSSDISLRRAKPSDQSTLEYWDTQPHVIAASGDDDAWEWQEELIKDVPWMELLIAERDGRPIGMIQIIDPKEEETHYWGDCESNMRAIDIWIGERDDLGKGYGTTMMSQALERCFSNKEVKGVLIDPLVTNVRACKFYERIGFEFVEQRTFGEDLCQIYFFSREQWENLHH